VPQAQIPVQASEPRSASAGPQQPRLNRAVPARIGDRSEVSKQKRVLEGIQNSPRVAAQRVKLEGLFGSRREPALPVQRRVHTLDAQGWEPGEKQREGNHPFPDVGKSTVGSFFNDVTGAVTSTGTAAAETLRDLLVKSGELGTIATKELVVEWSDLGSALKKEFKKEAKESLELEEWRKVLADPGRHQEHAEAERILEDSSDPFVELGSIAFGRDEVWAWKKKLSEKRVKHDKISSFLKSFMAANGQLDYIRRQPWFLNSTYGIEIDVNYYPHRGFEAAGGGYHKDTGGNNIFVNIIFHNDDPIPATELFPDAAPRSKKRRDLQAKLLPRKHRVELQSLRRKLRTEQPDPVRGGVVGRHAFASWVDDAVWHATPDFKNRPSLDKNTLMGIYAQNSSYDCQLNWLNEEFDIWKAVIRTLAEFSHTLVAKELSLKKRNLKNVNDAKWKVLWRTLYVDKGSEPLKNDLSQVPDEKLRFNRFLVADASEAIAFDKNLLRDRDGKQKIPGQTITEQPVGLATRSRANSDAKTQKEVREAQEKQDQKMETRSFIRTWVKIVRLPKK
jgi:hypothetical protein